MRRTPRRLTAPLLMLSLLIASCGGSEGTVEPPPPPDPATVLDRVTLSPESAEIRIGETQQLNAVAISEAGTTLQRTFTFASSSDAIATVSASGLVTAVSEGTAVITATVEGKSASSTITVPEPGPPAAPSGVGARALGGTEVEVFWNDNSPDEDEFIVFREIDAVFTEIARVPANTTTYTDTGLTPGETYRYRVKAVNARGESEFSVFGQATTLVPLVIVTDSVPDGIAGVSYSFVIRATGGPTSQYQWSVTGGELPPGLSLSAAGTLSGTPSTGGTYDFTAEVVSGTESMSASYSMMVVVPQADATFEIQLVYTEEPSEENRLVFEAAADRWEEVITTGMVEILGGIPATGCGPAFEDRIDDLLIYVTLDSIDGPSGTLGSAGPCGVRGGTLFTIVGGMTFDTADVARMRTRGTLTGVILHEMGHVLGIGTLWDNGGFIAGECVGNPMYTGQRTVAAWQALGGAGNVPIYGQGSSNDGSNCSHWDETVFGSELMTPFASGGLEMSTVTIESLGDHGFVVDPSKADSYILSAPPAPAMLRAPQGERLRHGFFMPEFEIFSDGTIRPYGGRR